MNEITDRLTEGEEFVNRMKNQDKLSEEKERIYLRGRMATCVSNKLIEKIVKENSDIRKHIQHNIDKETWD